MRTANTKVIETDVGDRNVLLALEENSWNFGGEQSGHVIMMDYATTGDGLISALQILAVLVEGRRTMSELSRQFEPVPQILKNVRFTGKSPLDSHKVKDAIEAGAQKLYGAGRILVRPSGTEPLIRIMAEGDDAALVAHVVDDIASAIGG